MQKQLYCKVCIYTSKNLFIQSPIDRIEGVLNVLKTCITHLELIVKSFKAVFEVFRGLGLNVPTTFTCGLVGGLSETRNKAKSASIELH